MTFKLYSGAFDEGVQTMYWSERGEVKFWPLTCNNSFKNGLDMTTTNFSCLSPLLRFQVG